MYATLGDLRTDVSKLARSSTSNVIAGSTEIDRAINKAVVNVAGKYAWPWKQYLVSIQTQAPYKTGTITLTANSRAVTGSSTVWSTGWTGMWLKLDSESEWYQVKSVDSTTALTLELPYNGGNTGSGKAYTLYKRQYTLPSVIDDVMDSLIYPSQTWLIKHLQRGAFDEKYSNHSEGSIYNFTKWSESYTTREYSAGTVAGTQSTLTLTGTNTAWLDNVNEGDEIAISGTKYNVLKVNSDTSITLVQLLQTTPSGTSYTAKSVRATVIEFGYLPNDEYNIEIPCYKRIFKAIDDNDIIPIRDEFLDIIRYKAVAEILWIHESRIAQGFEAKAKEELQNMLTDWSIGLDAQITITRE